MCCTCCCSCVSRMRTEEHVIFLSEKSLLEQELHYTATKFCKILIWSDFSTENSSLSILCWHSTVAIFLSCFHSFQTFFFFNAPLSLCILSSSLFSFLYASFLCEQCLHHCTRVKRDLDSVILLSNSLQSTERHERLSDVMCNVLYFLM